MPYKLRRPHVWFDDWDDDESLPPLPIIIVDQAGDVDTGLIAPCGSNVMRCADPIGFLAGVKDEDQS